MTSDRNPLADIALGDIVVLPDGRAMTARSKANLTHPVGSMASFVIAGEMEVLLSVPARAGDNILVYVPIDYVPESAENARVAAVGAANYWAPHLPALRGAMGEITYRVLEVRGSVDPIVIVYRGNEVIVFIRATFALPGELQVMAMRRSDANDVDVIRHAAVVIERDGVPTHVPDDLLAPERAVPLPVE